MNPNESTAMVTALAILISSNTPDNDDLALLAVLFSQLGDTLVAIGIQLEILSRNNDPEVL